MKASAEPDTIILEHLETPLNYAGHWTHQVLPEDLHLSLDLCLKGRRKSISPIRAALCNWRHRISQERSKCHGQGYQARNYVPKRHILQHQELIQTYPNSYLMTWPWRSPPGCWWDRGYRELRAVCASWSKRISQMPRETPMAQIYPVPCFQKGFEPLCCGMCSFHSTPHVTMHICATRQFRTYPRQISLNLSFLQQFSCESVIWNWILSKQSLCMNTLHSSSYSGRKFVDNPEWIFLNSTTSPLLFNLQP